jgi:hypothetical protein
VHGHAVDTIGQKGDLHVGRTCVPFVLLESLQNLQFSVFRDCHSVSWQQGSLKTRETTTKERLSFHDWLLNPQDYQFFSKKQPQSQSPQNRLEKKPETVILSSG